MNISQESIGHLNAKINIHLDPEDYKDSVNEELKRYARKANLPGFRAGKVPIGMVKKMVGKAIVVEEVNKKVSKELTQYLAESKLNILGYPMPIHKLDEDAFDPDCKKEMDFAFEVGLAPDVEINFNLENPPQKFEVEFSDESVEKELENYKDRFAEVTNPETVEAGDIIFGKLFEVDENGETVEGGLERMMALNPKRIENPELFSPFEGKSVSENLPLNVFDVHEDLEEISKLTFIETEELEALKDKSTHFEISRLNRVAPAEMNENFFTKVAEAMQWSETNFETEEAFIERFREQMAKDYEGGTTWHYRNELQKQLLAANPLELPDDFLKRWLLDNEDRYKTMLEVEKAYPAFSKSVFWSLLVEKIQEQEGIGVSDEEVETQVRDSIRESMISRGEEVTEEKLDEFAAYLKQNNEVFDSHKQRIINDRLYAFLEEKMSPEVVSIPLDDFIKKQEEAREAAKSEADAEEAAAEKAYIESQEKAEAS